MVSFKEDDHVTGEWHDDSFIGWIDGRIDRKIDKVKVWLFGVVLANLIPVLIFSYMFGQFTGRVEIAIEAFNDSAPNRYTQREHEAYTAEMNRRFEELNRRIEENSN